MSSKLRQSLSIAGFGLLVLCAYLISYKTHKEVVTPPEPRLSVLYAKPTWAPISQQIHTLGKLSPVRESKLSSGASGRIESIHVSAGTYVSKGRLLLSLQPKLEIRAPFDGMVSDWQVSEGEYIPVGFALAQFIEPRHLRVIYQIPEHYGSALKLGQHVEITSARHKSLKAQSRAEYISPEVSQSMTLEVRAVINNAKLEWVPGQSVAVSHLLNEKYGILIPEEALILTLEGYQVYRIVDAKAQLVDVTVGTQKGGLVEIHKGIGLEDNIIVVHSPLLRSGTKINMQTSRVQS